jgi:hypothetical protein
LVSAKIPRRIRRAPGRLSHKIKVSSPKRIFGARAGCGDVTSLYKNLVKKRKTNFRRKAIQEPIFLWLIQVLNAVAMGVVACAALFWSSVPNPAILNYCTLEEAGIQIIPGACSDTRINLFPLTNEPGRYIMYITVTSGQTIASVGE